jgi:uncharacterized membrane-anchored protein
VISGFCKVESVSFLAFWQEYACHSIEENLVSRHNRQRIKGMMKQRLSRVPEITLLFWVIKILSTTVGETGADYLSFRSGLGLGMTTTSVITGVLLAASIFVQFKLKRYVPTSYWLVVILMSIVGTLITDLLVDDCGVSLITLSIIFAVAMAVVFVVWYGSEKTLSIHSINTAKRELFYWIIILLAFALGTGIGDLISERLKLGYGVALLIFSLAIAVVVFAYYVMKLNSVLSFWIAFILTRPVGASLGDFMIKSVKKGGLGWGMAVVNTIFFFVIVAAIVYLSIAKKADNPQESG